MSVRRARNIWLVAFVVALGVAVWSWWSGGLVRVLVDGSGDMGDNQAHLAALRSALESWGPWAPVVYVAAVVLEVLVAPIPGTLLYAPAGALFGGLLGGTLSLIGNTIGAAVATGVGKATGEAAMARRLDGTRLARHQEAIRQRGWWLVLLLRLNPLTSSDLVSYAAGAFGVPVWRVALGTFIGMAPLCYLQAYLAQEIFAILPGAFYVLGLALIVYVVLVFAWLIRRPVETS